MCKHYRHTKTIYSNFPLNKHSTKTPATPLWVSTTIKTIKAATVSHRDIKTTTTSTEGDPQQSVALQAPGRTESTFSNCYKPETATDALLPHRQGRGSGVEEGVQPVQPSATATADITEEVTQRFSFHGHIPYNDGLLIPISAHTRIKVDKKVTSLCHCLASLFLVVP